MSTPRESFDRERAYIQRVVGQTFKRYRGVIEWDEALTVALGGLWRVALRHSHLPPDEFRILAARRAAGSIVDHCRSSDWRGRRGYKAVPNAVRFEYNPELDGFEPEPDDESESVGRLRLAVDRLRARERQVIQSRYLEPTPVNTTALAEQMGITAGRVSQLSKRAIERLRRELASA